ncbi:MAG: T9SS type A sorting domain-containing protein, partial [Pontibacter sp.]|nr:T9SS type A sorting domain-containing protein [Pontibacter sp.]
EGHSAQSEAITVTVGDGGATADLSDCLPGLVHYLDMDGSEDGNYTDLGTAASATCENCPEIAEDGLFEGATRFNGTNTGLDFSSVSNFNWAKGDGFSIGVWVRSSGTAGGNAVIVGRDAAATDAGVHWWIGLNPQGQAVFALKDAVHAGIEIGGSGPSLTDGNWHYIMAVRDGDSGMNKLYVDGTLVQEGQVTYENSFADEAPVNIGYLNRSGGFHYTGDLDELKIYSRALTQEEITQSFNGGSGTLCGQSPLGIVDNETFEGAFEVFPNPNPGQQVNIFVSELQAGEEITLTLVDMTGKVMLEKEAMVGPDGTVRTSIAINKELSTGLYNLLLFSKNRKLSSKVMIAK